MANEKRLIDANALLKELRQELRECRKDADEFGGENILWAEGIEFAIDTVKQMKKVDAVEVVRCKDCEQWKCHGIPFDITKGTCHNPRFHLHHGHVIDECFMPITNETHFCSYGERKEDA